MQEQHDAFGQALLANHSHRGGFAVIERDDGLVECDPLDKYFSRYLQWSPIARRIVRSAKGHVLDIGAGAGRHSLYLQRKGLRVTAIDVSAGILCSIRNATLSRHDHEELLRHNHAS